MKKMATALIAALLFVLSAVLIEASDASSISGLGVGEKAYDKAIFTLSAVEVMTENENGEFLPSKNITRAEFTNIIAKIMGTEGIELEHNFIDVPEFYKNVGYAVEAGYMSGYTDGTFRPDNWISYGEAVSVMVRLLGYDGVARVNGGYPNGYTNQAYKLGLLDDVNINFADNATRAGMAVIIYNAMSVKILYDTGEVIGTTLLEDKMTKLGLEFGNGIITGADGVSTDAKKINKGEISIDGVIYDYSEIIDINEFLGAEVDYFYEVNENIVIELRVEEHNVFKINADDIILADLNNIKYYRDERHNSDKSAKISKNAKYIYNHRMLENFDGKEADIDNGELTLVDIEDDGQYDIIIIDEYSSFIVNGINYEDNIIYLKDRLLNGKPYVSIYSEEEDFETYLTDKEGNVIEPGNVNTSGTISVFQSIDGSYTKIVAVNEYAEGIVSSIIDDEIIIADKLYKISTYNDLPLFNLNDISLGNSYIFCLDINDKVFDIHDSIVGDEQYGFIARILTDETSDVIKVRIINGRTYRESKDITKDEYDITRNMFTFANTGWVVAEIGDKVKYDGTRLDSKENILNFINEGDVVAYKMRADKVISFEPYYAHGTKNATRTLHYKTKTFGGVNGGAFFFDENTLFFINPANKKIENNFLIKLQLSDGGSVPVTGYGVDEETKIAKFAVMNHTKDYYAFNTTVTKNTRIAIVDRVKGGVNLEGEQALTLTGYYKNEWVTKYCFDTPELNQKAQKLKTGDIIYMFSALGDNLGDFELIASLKDSDAYGPVVTGSGTSRTEKIYGKLYDFKRNTLLDNSEMATDVITVSVKGDGTDNVEYCLPYDTRPVYYLYDPDTRSVSLYDGELVNGVQKTDLDKSDDVFIYKYGDEVKVVVFVKGGN